MRAFLLPKKSGDRQYSKLRTINSELICEDARMKNQYKTKKQLIEELEVLRNQLVKPKKTKANSKRAEEALRGNEETFRALAENAHDGIFVTIGKGIQAYANKRAGEITGYSVAELLRTSMKDLVHPGELKKIMQRYKKRLAGKYVPPRYETVIINKKRRSVPIELTAAKSIWQGQPADLVIIRDITKHKQSEQTLRESEERFRMVLESSMDNLYRRNLKTDTYDYMSPAVERILGYSPEEILSMPLVSVMSMMHPDDADTVKRVIGESMTSDRSAYLLEYRFRHKDGQYRWLSDLFTVVRDAQGYPLYFVGNVRDITERKQSEQMLRESEEKYRNLVERANDGIGIGQDEILQYVNPRLAQMIGYSVEELIGFPFTDFFNPDEVPKVIDRYRRRMAGEDVPPIYESALKHKDGSRIEVEINAGVISYNGKPADLILFRDITERKRSEDTLRESEERYRRIVDNSLLGIGISRGNKVVFANPALLRLFGYDDLEEFTKIPLLSHVAPASQGFISARMEKVAQGEPVPAEFEYDILCKDGRIKTLLASSQHFTLGGATYTQTTFQDITERKRTETALRESEERYRAVIESQIDLISRYRPDTTLTFVNDAYCQFYGKTREELIGHSFLSMVAPEFHELVLKETENLAKNPRSIEGEYLNYRQNGEECWIQWVVQCIGGENGRVVELQAVGRDITERKRAEKKLHESKNFLQDIFDGIQDGISVLDRNFTITQVNKWIEKMHHEDMPLIGKKCYEVYQKRKTVCPWCPSAKALSTGKVHVEDVRVLLDDGSFWWCGLSAYPLRGENDDVVGVIEHVKDITEHKRAEEALRESEERFRKLVETMKVGLASIDEKGVLTYVNEYCSTMLGYTIDEMIGRSTLDFYYDEESRKTQEEIFSKRRAGMRDPTPYEVTWRKKDGQKVYSILSPTPSFDANGRYTGSFAIHTDITERKRAEEALRESEERFRLAFENANTGVCLVDLEGNLTKVNNKMCEIFGYTKEELERMTVNNIAHPEDIDKSPAFIQRTLRGETDHGTFEKRYLHKKGHVVTCQVSSSLVRNADGSPLYFISHVHDITERKQAEEALHTSEAQLSNALKIAHLGHWEYDVASDLFTFSDHFYDIFRTTAEREGGHTMSSAQYAQRFVHPDDRSVVSEEIQKALETTDHHFSRQLEHRIIYGDGEIGYIAVRFFIVKDDQGRTVKTYGVNQDISERKRAEEKMESLQEQLRQSQKMEAIGRLAGGIAHDFNNLLTIIKGYSQLSFIELKEDSPLKKNIEHIHEATDRAANLVRQLLAFSRRQILEMNVLDLNAILANLDNMLRRVIGEDIELITVLAEDLGRVKTDPGWIEQAIMNLVVNSRDAMASGGKLTIETGNVDLDEASTYGHIGVEPGRYVMLSVSDTGVGITPEVMERLFEPFFSTKEKDKGTGLGLSTVYGIVKQSGGDIWVYSEPGKGATFKIYLPRVDEPLGERREKVLGNELLRGSETILLVEDEESVRKLALRILERQGYKVLSARDGDEALLICEQFKDPIHLMLTDVVMPGMSGHELAKRLKSSYPKMKVLYMSGYTDDKIVLHGVLVEGVNYIQKPFTVDALTKKVREVLEQ
jgi:two-component system cell cycle sensor histidine kinase/response regulator CckA